MAKLTDTLNTVDSGERIIAPAQGYSFLGGLADAAAGIGKAMIGGAERQRVLDQRDALNEYTQGVVKLRNQAEDAMRGNPFPLAASTTDGTFKLPSSQGAQINAGDQTFIPQDAQQGIENLSKLQKAVGQGRATQDALDLGLERFTSDMMAKRPDQAAAIFSAAKEMGLDHYMWRDQEYQSDQQDADQKGKNEGRAQAIAEASSMGYQGSEDDLYKIGSQLKQQALLAQQAKAAAEEARAAAAEGRTEADWLKKRADEQYAQVYTSRLSMDMGHVLDQVSQLVLGAGDNPESQSELLKIGGLANTFGQQYIAHLTNDMAKNGVSQEVQQQVLAEAQHRVQAFQDVLSGPASRLGQTMKGLQYFQNSFGLQAYQALPYYSWLKNAFGSQAAVDSIFGAGMPPALSPELTKKVAGEIQNFDPTKPNTGFQILQEIGALAKGNKSLADVPEAQVTGDHVRALASTSLGAARAILDPAPDNPDEYRSFLGSQGNLVIATNSLQPGYKDYNGFAYAVNAITGQEQTAALDHLMKAGGQFKTQALTTFQANRAAVGRLLEVGRTVVAAPQGQGIKVVNGQFVAYSDTKVTLKGVPGSSSAQTASVEPSATVKRWASDMNRAVNYLVATAKADPSLKGVSDQDLRNHYLTGAPLPKKEGETTKAAAPNWDRDAAALETELSRNINSMPTDRPLGVPTSFKDERDAGIRTIIGEAAGEGDKGMGLVAGVIKRRAQDTGKSALDIVSQPGQFESVTGKHATVMGVSENDPLYQRAAKIWDEAKPGEYDSFYAPKLQAQLGRTKPAWDDGTGQDIGSHRFFKGKYKG